MPSAFMTHISNFSILFMKEKAIFLPSGDHFGPTSEYKFCSLQHPARRKDIKTPIDAIVKQIINFVFFQDIT